MEILRPLTNDRASWRLYWQQQQQPWRTEPEIDSETQAYLQERLSLPPDVRAGRYPFKDIALQLERAHVEWILWHVGVIDWDDVSQRKKQGVDFRGADLRGLDLTTLPFVRVRFGLTWNEWRSATSQQRAQAAAHLEGANLWGANLEGARCHGAHFEDAVLAYAYLEGAQFRQCYLNRADMHSMHVYGTDFKDATIADERGHGPRIADVEWMDTVLSQMPWQSVRLLGDEVHARGTEQTHAAHDTIVDAYEQAVRAHEQVANALQGKGMDANSFRYRGKILQRQLFWKQRKWLLWLGSMILALVAGYGYRLWRIGVTYGFTILVWTCFYALLIPHLSFQDALLVAGTGHGLPIDASSLAWIVQGSESAVNTYILGPLIGAMVLLRLLGK